MNAVFFVHYLMILRKIPQVVSPDAVNIVMRIEHSQLSLTASHAATRYHARQEMRIPMRREEALRPPVRAAEAAAIDPPAPPSRSETTIHEPQKKESVKFRDARLLALIAFVERMTGKKVEIFDAEALAAEAPIDTPARPDPNAAPTRTTFLVHRIEERQTSETMQFAASGEVLTADGRRIAFSLEISLHEELYVRSESLAIAANRKDPLVFDLMGSDPGVAPIGKAHIRFDLDADGVADLIPALSPRQAFLAMDANGNGHIDDGRELFGPQTGHGFAELSCYDEDGNGWVDEADPIFSRLRLWRPGSPAAPSSLAELGIGAIALDSAQTPFTLRAPGREEIAQIKRSGVFLYEKGDVGSVREIDLVV